MLRTIVVLLAALVVIPSCSSKESSSPPPSPPPPAPAVTTAPASAAAPANTAEPATVAEPPLIDIPNARVVDGLLLGGAPTPEQLRAAAKAGYRTVIDLRMPAEDVDAEKTLAAELGLQYVALPVEGAAGLTDANVDALDQALREASGPTVVHCASGNRVGALLALRAAAKQEASPEDALALGMRAGLTKLEPAVRSKLGLTAAP